MAVNASKARGQRLASALLFVSYASDLRFEFVPKLDNQEDRVKRQYRYETRSIAPDQIETLVITLSRRARLLESDIEAEEERTRCTDRRDAAYSILARTLVARRDNLSATIAALRQRLAVFEVPERNYSWGPESRKILPNHFNASRLRPQAKFPDRHLPPFNRPRKGNHVEGGNHQPARGAITEPLMF